MTVVNGLQHLKILLSGVIVLLSMLACEIQVSPPVVNTPDNTPTHVFTPTAENVNTQIHINTVTIRATVYVRQLPDTASPEVGSFETGQSVEIVKCDGDWCEIVSPTGFVWRGCTDNNPDELRCEAAK